MTKRLRSFAERYGRPVSHVALAWIFRRPEVAGAIVGLRSPTQAEEIVGAADLRLTPVDVVQIDDLLRRRAETLTKTA